MRVKEDERIRTMCAAECTLEFFPSHSFSYSCLPFVSLPVPTLSLSDQMKNGHEISCTRSSYSTTCRTSMEKSIDEALSNRVLVRFLRKIRSFSGKPSPVISSLTQLPSFFSLFHRLRVVTPNINYTYTYESVC